MIMYFGNIEHNQGVGVIGRRLRELRDASGLTQHQLCKRVGLSPATISLYENGVKKPDYLRLNAIARALGATWQDIIPQDSHASFEPHMRRAQDVGPQIKSARELMGYMQAEVADRIQAPYFHYLDYESGDATVPISRLRKICEILPLDPEDLIDASH